MSSRQKEVDKFIRDFIQDNPNWEYLGKNKHHKLLYKPNGRKVFISQSPSCHRWQKNVLNDIKYVEENRSAGG